MKIFEAYPDLEDILKGARFKPFCDNLYKLAQVRYMTAEMLRAINHQTFSGPKVKKLADLQYLAINGDNLYNIGKLGFKLLSEQGYNLSPIQKTFKAVDGTHPLRVSEVILSIMGEDDFFAVIYPTFNFVIPDACIIRRRDSQVKIQMLEVEQPKANWREYLADKRDKYEQLARDEELWSRWFRHQCKVFGFNHCALKEFCFSVLCYSDVSFDWNGWTFRRIE